MGMIKNPDRVLLGVDVWIKRVETVYLEHYKDITWFIFLRLLNKTPQFSGKAVANWNIGVGGPDYTFDDSLGDKVDNVKDGQSFSFGDPDSVAAHVKGDRKWIQSAVRRNRPKLKQITRATKVYFNNAVEGDDDGGKAGTTLYLEALQNPAYWQAHLRDANKPYETAQETLIFSAERLARLRGLNFRAGGGNFEDLL